MKEGKMKKVRTALVIALLSVGFIAVANNGDPKPIVSNYSQVISQVEYPMDCREKGIEGTVMVQITVDRQGSMIDYKILESPCSDLASAVEKVLPGLSFQPALVDGKAVSSKILIPVEFRLTY